MNRKRGERRAIAPNKYGEALLRYANVGEVDARLHARTLDNALQAATDLFPLRLCSLDIKTSAHVSIEC